ncbi:uncharacterized protein LOC144577196 [Callithrix jacchus]
MSKEALSKDDLSTMMEMFTAALSNKVCRVQAGEYQQSDTDVNVDSCPSKGGTTGGRAEGDGRRPLKVLPRRQTHAVLGVPLAGRGENRALPGQIPLPLPPQGPASSPSTQPRRPPRPPPVPPPHTSPLLAAAPPQALCAPPLPAPALCLLPSTRSYSEKLGKGVTVKTESSRSESRDTSDPTYAQAHIRTSCPPHRPGRPSLRLHPAVNTAAQSSPCGPGPRADCGALAPPCG